MGYTKEAIKGISWIGALRFSTRIVAILRTIVLARILTSVQFGVYGIALLVTALLDTLTETGVNVVLIQEKEHLDKYVSSAWIISILRGMLIAIFIFLSSSLVAKFFHIKEVMPLLILMSLVPLLRGFINPSVIQFQKELAFAREFWYRFSIFSFDSLVTVVLAMLTQQASSLVFGMIAGVALEVVLSFLVVKPIPSFAFEKEYLTKLFHRGKWVTLSGIFNYLYHNIDTIVVGRILGASSLGLYEMAYRISMLPITEVADVVQRVTFPVYSKISGDLWRLRRAFVKTILAVAFITIPFGIVLFLFPSEIIKTVLGERWLEITPVLKILAIFGVVRAISGSSSALFLAVQKQKFVTVVTLVSFLALAIPIIPLTNSLGIMGAGLAVLVGSFLALPIFAYFISKIFKDIDEKR